MGITRREFEVGAVVSAVALSSISCTSLPRSKSISEMNLSELVGLFREEGVELEIIDSDLGNAQNIRELYRQFRSTPKTARQSLSTIRIVNDDYFHDNVFPQRGAIACYDIRDDSLYIVSFPNLNYACFRHEVAHARHASLMPEQSIEAIESIFERSCHLQERYVDITQRISELMEENDRLQTGIDSRLDQEINRLCEQRNQLDLEVARLGSEYNQIFSNADEFSRRWVEVSAPYDGSLISSGIVGNTRGISYWKDATCSLPDNEEELESLSESERFDLFGPRHGFASIHDATNVAEDVGKYVEIIVGNPKYFRPVVDKKSHNYDKRFVDKIELLLEYVFISRNEYRSVFRL